MLELTVWLLLVVPPGCSSLSLLQDAASFLPVARRPLLQDAASFLPVVRRPLLQAAVLVGVEPVCT